MDENTIRYHHLRGICLVLFPIIKEANPCLHFALLLQLLLAIDKNIGEYIVSKRKNPPQQNQTSVPKNKSLVNTPHHPNHLLFLFIPPSTGFLLKSNGFPLFASEVPENPSSQGGGAPEPINFGSTGRKPGGTLAHRSE